MCACLSWDKLFTIYIWTFADKVLDYLKLWCLQVFFLFESVKYAQNFAQNAFRNFPKNFTYYAL